MRAAVPESAAPRWSGVAEAVASEHEAATEAASMRFAVAESGASAMPAAATCTAEEQLHSSLSQALLEAGLYTAQLSTQQIVPGGRLHSSRLKGQWCVLAAPVPSGELSASLSAHASALKQRAAARSDAREKYAFASEEAYLASLVVSERHSIHIPRRGAGRSERSRTGAEETRTARPNPLDATNVDSNHAGMC